MSGTQWWDGSTQPLTQFPPPQVQPSRRGPWPRATDYTQAIQDPSRVFSDPLLKSSRVETTMLGLPAAATGQNAIVFKVLAQGQPHAVRCFTPTQGEPSGDTYKRLAAMQLPAEMVPARWIENGIRVKQQDWPALAMPWIAGDTLNIWLEDNARDRGRVLQVRDALRATYRKLRSLNIVHGDLHHGNIIVTPQGAVRLVDFDGVCIFGPSGDTPITERPTEVGHPNYQHPQRIRHGSWHRYTDTFAALLIDVSLSAIAAQPDRYVDTGDSLLFTRDDLETPEAGKAFTTARSALSHSPDDLRLVNVLQAWCGRQERAEIDLAGILAHRDLPPSAAYTVADDGGHRKADRVASDWSATTKAPKSKPPKAGSRPQSPTSNPSPTPAVGANNDGFIGLLVVVGLLFAGWIFFGVMGDSGGSGTASPPRTSPAPATPQAPALPTAPIDVVEPNCRRPASLPELRQGSRGSEVRVLQTRLGLTVDGSFGPQTDTAVRRFQRAQSLTASGVVGDSEWAFLGLTCPGEDTSVGRQIRNDGVWPVGTCLRQSGTDVQAVRCAEQHDAVVTSLLRGGAEEFCPQFFWPGQGEAFSDWIGWSNPVYFGCIGPSMTAEQLAYRVGACVVELSGNRVSLAPCSRANTWTIYARVTPNRSCPSPTRPRDSLLRWMIVSEQGSSVHYCYQ